MSEIEQLKEYVEGHTPGPWEWAYGGFDGVELKTKDEFLRFCGEIWDLTEAAGTRTDHLHMICANTDKGEQVVVAIVGNGPCSEKNAKLIVNAPRMLRLLSDRIAWSEGKR